MSEVYHPDGTPTGPARRFAEWDLEIDKTPTGYRWHTCNGRTLAGSGTARTRLGARLAARWFALTTRHHRARTQPGQHLVITLKSGTQIQEPTTAYTVRVNPLTGALTRTNPGTTRARVALAHLNHYEPATGAR